MLKEQNNTRIFFFLVRLLLAVLVPVVLFCASLHEQSSLLRYAVRAAATLSPQSQGQQDGQQTSPERRPAGAHNLPIIVERSIPAHLLLL